MPSWMVLISLGLQPSLTTQSCALTQDQHKKQFCGFFNPCYQLTVLSLIHPLLRHLEVTKKEASASKERTSNSARRICDAYASLQLYSSYTKQWANLLIISVWLWSNLTSAVRWKLNKPNLKIGLFFLFIIYFFYDPTQPTYTLKIGLTPLHSSIRAHADYLHYQCETFKIIASCWKVLDFVES